MAEHVTLCVFIFYISFITNGITESINDDNEVTAVSYDGDTFEAGLSKNRNFVMFYAPWCGHCKNLSPTWDELAKIYNTAEDNPVIIAKVDCTVYTSLCAEHDIVGFPTLKLFEVGGESHKRYSGKRDLESMKAFVQEQINGIAEQETVTTTEEEKPAEFMDESPVVSLDDDNFSDSVAGGLYFIKFYAPWCGHCKRLAPVWEDLASSFKDNDKVAIAKIDCTQSTTVCKQFEIRGYPTLLWVKHGQKADQFQGPRTLETLQKFVQDRLEAELSQQYGEEAEKVPEDVIAEEVAEAVKGIVVELTEESYKTQITYDWVFVKFYAPWCGHCKRLAPAWEDLAKAVSDKPVLIAKVDCTQYKSICDQNEVRGYPTLKLFRNGELVKEYRGGRSLEDMSAFVTKETEPRDEL